MKHIKRYDLFFSALLGLSGALGLCGAAAAQTGDPKLVFYDSISTNDKGEAVLKGGVYADAQQAAVLRQLRSEKAAALMPADGYYHMRFVADASAMGRAQEFANLLMNHEAFASIRDRFRIEFVQGEPDRMNCRNDMPGSPRVIRCDMAYALSLGTEPAHMTGIFTSRGSGGAGGSVPVSSLDYPMNTMLHEMLHLWKLNDEYTYSKSEADTYCAVPDILKGPNTTTFPAHAGYSSNDEALRAHAADIPWLARVRLPITATGEDGAVTLGTPAALASKTEPGLFSGSNCSLKFPSFRPYGVDNIMKTLSTNFITPIQKDAVLAEIARVAGWAR